MPPIHFPIVDFDERIKDMNNHDYYISGKNICAENSWKNEEKGRKIYSSHSRFSITFRFPYSYSKSIFDMNLSFEYQKKYTNNKRVH